MGVIGGNAGTININPTTQFVLSNSTVSTNSTAGPGGNFGAAGSITIDSGLITLNQGSDVSSNTYSFGAGGVVTLNSGSNVVMNSGATVSTTTSGFNNVPVPGTAGNAGDIFVTAVNDLLMTASLLTSSTSGDGDAGNITINTGHMVYLLNSTVLTDANTPSMVGGGNLDVSTYLLILDSSTLDASSNFATGGNVTINAAFLLSSPDSVIDVSGATGSGTLTVNALAVDLSGGLTGLNVQFQDAGRLLRQACDARAAGGTSSSFIIDNGINGLPPSPDGLQSDSPLNIDVFNKVSMGKNNTKNQLAAAAMSGASLMRSAAICGGI
jgi:large exoprotein involved in heme utilization and adhesion